MYTRSRGNQQQQNTNFVRGPTLNPANAFPPASNSFPQVKTPTSPAQVQGPQTPGRQQTQPQQPQMVQKPTQQPQQQASPKPMQQMQQQLAMQQQQMQQQLQLQQQQTPEKAAAAQGSPALKTTAAQNLNLSLSNVQGSTPAISIPGLDNPMEFEEGSVEADGFSETSDIPRWKRNKLQGTKVNRKLRRLRMNQRLRKTLMPKNAIMVLNEMKAGVQFTFPESQAVPNSLFLVHAELDGKTYVGQGLSKPLARQNAAENALKCLLLEKMTAAANKARTDAENDVQGTTAAGTEEETPSEETPAPKETDAEITETTGTDSATATPMAVDDTDEIPWSSLASFALYKLFLEWQNQGTVVPIPRPGTQTPPKTKAEQKPPVEKELPQNALSVHPVMLLNQMKPGTTYVEVNRAGNPPNTLFTLSVEIDGKVYTGTAKNKKDAKKVAAKAALQALYGLEYPEEPKPETIEPMQLSETAIPQVAPQ